LFFFIHCVSWVRVEGFEAPTAYGTHCHRLPIETRRQLGLFSSAGNDMGDSMRKMLEASWNTSKMGRVPADPEAAAKEACSSILRAAGGTKEADSDDIEEHDNMSGIFFVDLLLPSYDISQVYEGTKLYDEVAAVEYCIALANCFNGKTEILVRDNGIVQMVEKVLKAREEQEAEVSDGDFVFGEETTSDDGNVSIDITIDGVNDDPDPDDFRQKLLANWNEDIDSPSEDGIDMAPPKPKTPVPAPTSASKSYRLASLFGNARINQGPDMAQFVIQAVRENALAADDEDNIIILSAVGKDEMVAVRGLVAKYGSEKKIVMVNCQFQPVPRELLAAETVYSVLPLAGRKTTNSNGQGSDNENESPPPKIVVLRRYPKDWEVFVDVGSGYELAESVPANGSNRRGLDMEFIARAVTRHLDFVSRR